MIQRKDLLAVAKHQLHLADVGLQPEESGFIAVDAKIDDNRLQPNRSSKHSCTATLNIGVYGELIIVPENTRQRREAGQNWGDCPDPSAVNVLLPRPPAGVKGVNYAQLRPI